MKKIFVVSSLAVSLILITGCDDSVEKSVESAEDFKKLASEFNSLVDDMELKTTATEIEGKVSEGLASAKDLTKKIVKKNNPNNKPVAQSGAVLIEAKVVMVVDGDTIDIHIPNGEILGKRLADQTERVRLILVNTPESEGKYKNSPQPYALEASAFTKDILKGATVWLEKGVQERDQYGRLLAYVWLNDISINVNGEKQTFERITMNELLLQVGLAHVAIYPPNTQYLDEFKAVEKVAKQNKVGMWAEE